MLAPMEKVEERIEFDFLFDQYKIVGHTVISNRGTLSSAITEELEYTIYNQAGQEITDVTPMEVHAINRGVEYRVRLEAYRGLTGPETYLYGDA